jgi:hypothetical protein
VQPETQSLGLGSFLPLLLMSVVIAVSSHLLARDKGRNILKWTVLGAIPLLNIFCIWFFVGAANLRLERKIDDLIARLEANAERPPQ